MSDGDNDESGKIRGSELGMVVLLYVRHTTSVSGHGHAMSFSRKCGIIPMQYPVPSHKPRDCETRVSLLRTGTANSLFLVNMNRSTLGYRGAVCTVRPFLQVGSKG